MTSTHLITRSVINHTFKDVLHITDIFRYRRLPGYKVEQFKSQRLQVMSVTDPGGIKKSSGLQAVKRIPVVLVFFGGRDWKVFEVCLYIRLSHLVPSRPQWSELDYSVRAISADEGQTYSHCEHRCRWRRI